MTKYSYEFKKKIVSEYLNGQGGYESLGKKYGVGCKCQFNFVQKVENNFVQFSALNRLAFKECALILQPV